MTIGAFVHSRFGRHERSIARLISAQRSRYLVIAGFCAASNNVIMIAGDRAGESYPVMTLVSFIVLTPIAYALHTWFTFAERFSIRRLLRYASGMAMALPLSLLVMAILCTVFKLRVFIAAPITTVIIFTWNYAAANFLIVGDRRQG